MFLVCHSWAWLGMFLSIFSCLPPPQCRGWSGSSGPSLFAQETFPELWAGFRCSWRLPCYVSSRPADPLPARELGAIWITLTIPTEELKNRTVSFFFLTFHFFGRHFLAPPTSPVVWRWLSLTIFSCLLRLGLPFFLCFDVPCRLRCLTVQRCGRGF